MRESPEPANGAHRGPPLTLLAAVHGALFVASLLVLNGAADGGAPLPGSAADGVARFFDANAGLLRVVGMLQFGAAMPLALFAATAASRLRHLGVRAAGTTIALAGGLVAAGFLAVSGLLTVTGGAITDRTSASAVVLVHELTFFVGGAGYIVFFGLLLAGLAISGLLAGLLPRAVGVAAVVVFVVAELSTLSLAIEPLTATIPVARFTGLVVLVALAAKLPVRRVVHTP